MFSMVFRFKLKVSHVPLTFKFNFLIHILRDYGKPGCLSKAGAVQLRPWMLNFHPQMGLRGYVEPDCSLVFPCVQTIG